MKKHELAQLVSRHEELETDAIKLMAQFKDVSINEIIKKSVKLAATGRLNPEGFGLPDDVFERVQEYQRVGEKLRSVLNQLVGVNHVSE